jgi:FHA domain
MPPTRLSWGEADPVTVDMARAAVIAGDGVVARYPGLLCVAQGPDQAALMRLLDVCAAAAGPEPGRGLARRLSRWIGGPDGPDDDLVFGTVAAAGDRLAVFLVGAVSVTVQGSAAALSGVDAATWTDRLIRPPDAPVVLSLEGVVPPSGLASGPNDLRAGVVPGGGAVLFTGSDSGPDPLTSGAAARPGDDHEWFAGAGEPERSSLPWPDAVPPARNGTTERVVRTPLDEVAAPVTNGRAPARPGAGDGTGGSLNTGRHAILDPRAARGDVAVVEPRDGHDILSGGPLDGVAEHDPPGAAFDLLAPGPVAEGGGAPGPPATALLAAEPPPPTPAEALPVMPPLPRRSDRFAATGTAERDEGTAAAGSRLPLGRIVFDDGATYPVDGQYLVGRLPESDPRVRSGELRPIVLEDDGGSVSRAHAEILIKGWEVLVVDSGSRNGTFAAGPDESVWTPLTPGHPSRLVPGTRVRLGGRTFVFEKDR